MQDQPVKRLYLRVMDPQRTRIDSTEVYYQTSSGSDIDIIATL